LYDELALVVDAQRAVLAAMAHVLTDLDLDRPAGGGGAELVR
jgi:hypothetical protein